MFNLYHPNENGTISYVSQNPMWKTQALSGGTKFANDDDAIAMVNNPEFGIWNRLVAARLLTGVTVEYNVIQWNCNYDPSYILQKAIFTVGSAADCLIYEIMYIMLKKLGYENTKVSCDKNGFCISEGENNIILKEGDIITVNFDAKGNYQSFTVSYQKKTFWKRTKTCCKTFSKKEA